MSKTQSKQVGRILPQTLYGLEEGDHKGPAALGTCKHIGLAVCHQTTKGTEKRQPSLAHKETRP